MDENLSRYVKNLPIMKRDPWGLVSDVEQSCYNRALDNYWDSQSKANQSGGSGSAQCEKKLKEANNACDSIQQTMEDNLEKAFQSSPYGGGLF